MQRTKIFNAIMSLIVLAEYVGLALWAKSAFAELSKDKEDFFAGLSFWMGLEFVVTITVSLIFAFVTRLYLVRKITQNAAEAAMWVLTAMLFAPPLAIGLLNGDMSSGRSPSSNGVLVAKYFGGLIFPYVLVAILARLLKRRSLN